MVNNPTKVGREQRETQNLRKTDPTSARDTVWQRLEEEPDDRNGTWVSEVAGLRTAREPAWEVRD